MANTTAIYITHPENLAQMDQITRTGDAKEVLKQLIKYLDKVNSGNTMPGNVTVDLSLGGTAGVQASGTLTLSSSSGTVGGTIGGTSVTVSYATSDANTASLLCTAINANTTVNKLVYATVADGVVTLKSYVKSAAANKITLVASGTGSSASGPTLTGGAGHDAVPTTYQFS